MRILERLALLRELLFAQEPKFTINGSTLKFAQDGVLILDYQFCYLGCDEDFVAPVVKAQTVYSGEDLVSGVQCQEGCLEKING